MLNLNKLSALSRSAFVNLKEIETKLNNIVRTITWNKKFSRVTQLYKNLKLLKLRDVYNLKLAKFMHQIYNNKTPFLFQDKFNKLEKIHSHKSKKPSSSNFFPTSRIKKYSIKKTRIQRS